MGVIGKIRCDIFMQILEKQKLVLTYILVFFGLGGCLIIYLSNLEQSIDVSFVDEPSYLISGIHFFQVKSPVEYGRLYSFWYWIISNFYTRPTDIFYFNTKAMMFLLPLSSFILLASMRVKPVLCFLFSYFFALCYMNLVSPFVGHFAEIIILSSFTVLTIVKWSRFRQILFVSFVFLICTYFRPEYKLSFVLVTVYALLEFFYKKQWQNKMDLPFIAIFLTAVSLAILVVGNPFEDKTNRTLLAFEQHYAFNYVERNNLDINPFTEYKKIMKKEFGDYISVKECIISQPAKIATHILQNVMNYLWCVKTILIRSILPCTIFLFVLIILSFGFLVRISFNQLGQNIPWVGSGIILLYIFSALPSLITVVLIAPRYHYLITQYHLVLLPLAILIFKLTNQKTFSGKELIFTLVIIGAVLFKGYKIRDSEYVSGSKPNLSNIQLIETVTKEINNLSGVGTSDRLLEMARPDAKIFQLSELTKMLDRNGGFVIVTDKNQESEIPLAVTANLTKIVGQEVIVYFKK